MKKSLFIGVGILLFFFILYRLGNGGLYSPAYGEKVVCEVKNQSNDRRIQVVSYQRYFFIFNFHETPDEVRFYRMRYLSSKLLGSSYLSTEGDSVFVLEKWSTICQQAGFIGKTIIVFPFPSGPLVSEDGGKSFQSRRTPGVELAPDFEGGDGSARTITWYDLNLKFINAREARLEQAGVIDPTKGPVPESVVIKRWLVTRDAGKTWILSNYSKLQPKS